MEHNMGHEYWKSLIQMEIGIAKGSFSSIIERLEKGRTANYISEDQYQVLYSIAKATESNTMEIYHLMNQV